jgi:hypothetical protein
VRAVLVEVVEERGTRTDEAHVPPEYVPELRELVEPPASEGRAGPGYVGGGPLRIARRSRQGAEFQNPKGVAVSTSPRLREEEGASIVPPNPGRDGTEERGQPDEKEKASPDIEAAFCNSV